MFLSITMQSSQVSGTVMKWILVLASILTATMSVKIEKLVVPEVVQSGTLSAGVVLDCQYSVAKEHFTLQWIYNHSDVPVYQWSPGSEPIVKGILEGRLDLTFRISSDPYMERRALRLVEVEPELSGQYTCRLVPDGAARPASRTKSMLVYSPESDFTLQFHRHHNEVEIKCVVRGLYPQPELIIQHSHLPFVKQQQRVWRSGGLLYDAESSARVPAARTRTAPAAPTAPTATCRLQLPQAGYVAIRSQLLHLANTEPLMSAGSNISGALVLIVTIPVLLLDRNCFT